MAGESRTVLEFELVDSLEDTDVLYLIRGTGVNRDKRVLGSSVRTALRRSDLVSLTLAGDTTVDLTLATNRNGIFALGGTTVADYTATLTGELPVRGQTTVVANGSLGTVTLAGALFSPGIPVLLPGESVVLDWVGSGLCTVRQGYTPTGFVNRMAKSGQNAPAYPSAVGSSSLPGDILIIRNGVLERITAADLHGQTYELPLSGLYAFHILDSTAAGSSVEMYTNFGSITKTAIRGSSRYRWRIAWWGSLDNASVVSSSRFVTLSLVAPSPVVTDGDRVATDVIGSFSGGRRHWPVSVTISNDGTLNVYQVVFGHTHGPAGATDELQIFLQNPDGSRMTYAQLKTLIGSTRVGFTLVVEGDS